MEVRRQLKINSARAADAVIDPVSSKGFAIHLKRTLAGAGTAKSTYFCIREYASFATMV